MNGHCRCCDFPIFRGTRFWGTSPAHGKLNNPCRRDSNLEFFFTTTTKKKPPQPQPQPQSLPDRNGRHVPHIDEGNVQVARGRITRNGLLQNVGTYVCERPNYAPCASSNWKWIPHSAIPPIHLSFYYPIFDHMHWKWIQFTLVRIRTTRKQLLDDSDHGFHVTSHIYLKRK